MHVRRDRLHSLARSRNGFTLLELLVAMTILAIMAATATAGLRLIAQAFAERSGDAAVLSDRARMSALARDLLSRARSGVTGDDAAIALAGLAEDERAFFAGSENAVRFVTDGTVYEAGRALYQHRLSIKSDAGGATLVLASTPVALGGQAASAGATEPITRTLLVLPEGSRFGYLDRAHEGEERWQTDWQDGARLPGAVRLTDSGGNILLLARRMITLPTGCALAQTVSQTESQAVASEGDSATGGSVLAAEATAASPSPAGPSAGTPAANQADTSAASPPTLEPACTP